MSNSLCARHPTALREREHDALGPETREAEQMSGGGAKSVGSGYIAGALERENKGGMAQIPGSGLWLNRLFCTDR